MVMRVLTVGNGKGGVGKTTTAFTLSHVESRKGSRVLMVDMDSSGSLTACATGKKTHNRTLGNVFGGAVPALNIANIVQNVGDGIDLAAGGAPLVNAEVALSNKVGREGYLRRALAACKDRYDLVIIDTPPTCTLLTLNALVAADAVLIPTQAQALDLAGLEDFRRLIAEVQEMANPRLKIAGVVATFFNPRLKEHRHALRQIADAGLPLCKATIGRSVRVAEASRHCRSITDYATDNPQSVAYAQLADEINIFQKGTRHHA